MPELLSGTVTFFFSDIEGSTRLLRASPDAWPAQLERHRQLLRAAFATHGGGEMGTEGDSFFAAFPTAPGAVAAATDIQRALAAESWPADGEIRVRIGLHTGEALRDESDFYGKNVVVAARITDQARGGEILASAVVKELTESAGDLGFEKARDVELAGLAGTHAIYRVV